ncbi:MAG TPA: bifunctional adenosylcobinamide kinase/adenosylcobinamide-phosphate guanylyltransferase [Rhodospirillaceae bacterium]|nr:bifunctional adenosylcobinamide kinase/adenosylcobinamide-phosphate guanylyltransferase [Rhodospirillaceae bacterium]
MPPQLTLVLGGARSGKSAYAEALLADAPEAVYLATAQPGDEEMAERIHHHQSRRGAAWTTVEEPLDLTGALALHCRAGRPLLVDCLTLWLSNVLLADGDPGAAIERLAAALPDLPGRLVMVANEVGLGIVPDNALARAFRDHAGRLNQRVAAAAQRVVFIAAGLPLMLKDHR